MRLWRVSDFGRFPKPNSQPPIVAPGIGMCPWTYAHANVRALIVALFNLQSYWHWDLSRHRCELQYAHTPRWLAALALVATCARAGHFSYSIAFLQYSLGPWGGVEIGGILRGSYANLPQSLELVFGDFSEVFQNSEWPCFNFFASPMGFVCQVAPWRPRFPVNQSRSIACTKSRSSTVNYLVRFNQSRVIRSTLHVFLPRFSLRLLGTVFAPLAS